MRRTAALATTLALVPAAATPVAADLVGAAIVDVGNPEAAYTTYRVHLVFDAPDDQLLWVGEDTALSPFHFIASGPLFNAGGAFQLQRQEDLASFPLSGAYDSWVTIAHDHFAANDTDRYYDFPSGKQCVVNACIESDELTAPLYGSGGWYDSRPETPALPDVDDRILIAQFTVPTMPDGAPGQFWMRATAEWQDVAGAVHRAPFETSTTCHLDLDFSQAVDFGDVLLVLSHWGSTSIFQREDIDDSGVVDAADLMLLLNDWGPCPP